MTLTTSLAVRPPPVAARLDYALLRRAFLALAIGLAVAAPFSSDPIAFAAGGIVPWIVLRIVGTATMPAAVLYFLLWQWLQVYARTLLGLIDNEEMARGLYGPWVADAYWYMLASVVALALGIRVVLTTLRAPSPQHATAHLEWRVTDLFLAYVATLAISTFARVAADFVPAVNQQMEAVYHVKIVALFVLFATILSSGKGTSLLVAALGIELVTGFSGFQSDFRSVFIILFIAAVAARVRWTPLATVVASAGAVMLVLLALFWTSVKGEFREFATKSDDSQNIKVSLDARLGYLGDRLAASGEIDWNSASYALLTRLAYVDIFGSVIGVKLVSPEKAHFRQWGEALSHVFQPRFLFPDKVSLSDTEVFIRLARGDSTEQMRRGTSISVGYLAENYVDFDFPGMLGSVFVIGLFVAAVCRYFATVPLPWMVREGIIMAFIWAIGSTGVEVSLPKLFGAAFTFFVVYAVLAKFALPSALRWLDGRAAIARRQDELRLQARGTRQSVLK